METQDGEGADGEENPDFMTGLYLCTEQSGESCDCLGKPPSPGSHPLKMNTSLSVWC